VLPGVGITWIWHGCARELFGCGVFFGSTEPWVCSLFHRCDAVHDSRGLCCLTPLFVRTRPQERGGVEQMDNARQTPSGQKRKSNNSSRAAAAAARPPLEAPPALPPRPLSKGNKREILADIAERIPVELMRQYFNYPLRSAAEVRTYWML